MKYLSALLQSIKWSLHNKALSGSCLEAVATKAISICLLVMASMPLRAQSESNVPLSEALLEVAVQHKVSIIFNPKKIGNRGVTIPPEGWSLSDRMSFLLEGSPYDYEIKDAQVYLHRKRQLYGYIEDATSGERLISASIYIPATGQYDISNEYGYFSVSTIRDSVEVELSYLGYKAVTRMIYVDQMDRPIELKMIPDNKVTHIVISDALASNDARTYIELSRGSDILLYQNQASSAVGGEPDILQSIMRQSGVNTGADGIGGIHIRGGRNDQNQILYDGVRLYNATHGFGVYSIINNTIIDQATLYKSGAYGSYAGRLSSVIDVRTKDPNLKSGGAHVQFSTLASQAMLDIPILQDRLGILVSARRTHIDPLIKKWSSEDKESYGEYGEFNFNFDDYSLKAYAKLSNNQKLYLNLYSAGDRYTDDTQYELFDGYDLYDIDKTFKLRWRSQLASLRYSSLIGAKTIANLQVSSYNYQYANDYLENSARVLGSGNLTDFDRFLIDFKAGTTSYDLNLDIQTQLEYHELKYGFSGGIKDYHTGSFYQEVDSDIIDPTLELPLPIEVEEIPVGRSRGLDLTLYFSDKYKIGNRWYLDGGIYANYYRSVDQLYLDEEAVSFKSVYGYLKTSCLIDDHWNIGFSAGRYVQNEHLLTTGDNGYPSDIWIPSTTGLDPARSRQAEVFLEYKNKGHRLAASTYLKDQSGIIIFDTIAVLPSVTNLEADLVDEQTILADNVSYGVEIEYSYALENRFSFRTMYSYTKSDLVFRYEDFEDFVYPYEFSIPHTFNIACNVQLANRYRLVLDWYYATGKPYTLYSSPILYTPLEKDSDVEVIQVSDYNELRLPSTHKLSIAVTGFWQFDKSRLDISLGIQNVYNRRNIIYTYELLDDGIRSQQGFPLLPMIRCGIRI